MSVLVSSLEPRYLQDFHFLVPWFWFSVLIWYFLSYLLFILRLFVSNMIGIILLFGGFCSCLIWWNLNRQHILNQFPLYGYLYQMGQSGVDHRIMCLLSSWVVYSGISLIVFARWNIKNSAERQSPCVIPKLVMNCSPTYLVTEFDLQHHTITPWIRRLLCVVRLHLVSLLNILAE